MALPGWIYLRSSQRDDTPLLKWSAWEDSMEKIVEGSGGFSDCSNGDVVRYLRQLCEGSLERWSKDDSVVLERASNSVVFSCEVRSDVTFVQWRLENSSDGDIKCRPGPHKQAMEAEPAFVFDKKGELNAIEFWGRNRERQSVNAANCRRKAELTVSRNVKTESMEAVDRLPRLKSDPQDWVMANRMCFQYDVNSAWNEMRESVNR
jgi:hypothetical protein